MPQFFISYSRKDLTVAEKIINALAKDDLEPWIDWKSIPKGEEFGREIQLGIEGSEIFLFLVSPDSVKSEWCNKEIAYAVKNGKRILPIVIRNTETKLIHPEISKRNWIYCRDGRDDFNRSIGETRKTIHTDYEWLKYHTELQMKALNWEKKKDTSRLLRGKELRETEMWLGGGNKKFDPKLTGLQQEYIGASRRFEKNQQRYVIFIAVSVLFLVVILGAFGLFQKNTAVERSENAATEIVARQAAEIQAASEYSLRRSQQLGSAALEQLIDNPDLALLLSVEAFRTGDTFQARKALAASLNLTNCVKRYFYTGGFSAPNVYISSDQKKLIAAGVDDGLIVWDLEVGTTTNVLSGELSGAFAVTHDGAYIATSPSEDGVVNIWDMQTHEKIGELNTNLTSIRDMEFGNQGKILAIVYAPAYIELWDINNYSKIKTLIKTKDGFVHQNFIQAMAFNHDDTLLAASGGYASDGLIVIWDIKANQGEAKYIIPPEVEAIHDLAFDSSSSLFSYSDLKQIFLVSLEDAANTAVVVDTDSYIQTILFNSSGSGLISGHANGVIRSWDIQISADTQAILLAKEYRGHGRTKTIKSIDISGASNLMASADNTGRVILWDLQNCRPEFKPSGVSKNIFGLDSLDDVASLAINMAAGRLAVATYEGRDIILFNLEDHTQLGTLKSESDRIGLMAFSNSGSHLAVSEVAPSNFMYGDTIRIWDLNSPSREWKAIDISMLPAVSALAFDAGESTLALGTSDGKIYFYDIFNEQFVLEPITHSEQGVELITYSPDGKLLASLDRSGKIVLWDANSMLPIADTENLPAPNPLSIMWFSEDSSTLILGMLDNSETNAPYKIKWEFTWKTSPAMWANVICNRVGRNLGIGEWQKHFPEEPYNVTCPQWPTGE